MFKDVVSTNWFYQALERMVKLGRIAGYADNTFRPNNPHGITEQ